MACFVVGKNGFYKQKTFDRATLTHSIEWVKSIRDAKVFTNNSAANGAIDKHGLDAFVWNPYAETHIPSKWEVRFIASSYFNGKKSNVNMWQHHKNISIAESDVRYLQSEVRNPGPKNELIFDTEQEAIEKCIELNKILIEEMEIRMIAQKGQRMDIISKPYNI